MSSILDYIGATILLGVIILTVMRMNQAFMTTNYNHTLKAMNQESVMGYVAGDDTVGGFAGMVDFDLYKAGYQVESHPILCADTNRFTFSADLANVGTLDTITYYVKSAGTIPAGKNQARKNIIFRKKNNNEVGGWGASQFSFSYFDFMGRRINIPAGYETSQTYCDSIRSIKVQVRFEGSTRAKSADNPADTSFATVYWEKIISPKNLQAL